MAFQKGQSGNPGGRTKGTPNKTTLEHRDFLQEVLSNNFSTYKIARDLKELTPKNRLDYLFRLMEFIIPKPKPQELEDNKSANMAERHSALDEYLQRQVDNINKKEEGEQKKTINKSGSWYRIRELDEDGNPIEPTAEA